MTTQTTSRRPRRTDGTAGQDGWAYVALAIVFLAAIILVLQVAPYA